MVEIENLNEREEAARLLNAYRDATEAYVAEERKRPPLTQDQHERLTALNERYAAEKMEILGHDQGLQDLSEAEEAALDAYNVHELTLLEDEDGRPLRCAISRAPICDYDEIVEDPETGETFLRSATGLPPREDIVYEDEEEAA